MKKFCTLALFLCALISMSAQTPTDINVSSTIKHATVTRGGMNNGGFDYFWSLGYKNFIGAHGNPGFEPFQQRQIYQVSTGPLLGDANYIQANLNNQQYDGIPYNFYPTNNATLTVVYSPTAAMGCTKTIVTNSQASTPFSVTLVSISGTNALYTATVSGIGTNVIGAKIGLRVSGVTGGTGAINGVYIGTIINSTTITFSSTIPGNAAGASSTGATIASGQGPLISWFNNPCAVPLQPGDIFVIQWTNNSNTNLNAQLGTSGGAVISTEGTDLCTAGQTVDPNRGDGAQVYNGCGTRAVSCTGTTSSWGCSLQWTVDNSTAIQNFLMAQGNYLSSYMTKLTPGTAGSVSMTMQRFIGAGQPMSINYSWSSFPSTTWTQKTQTQALNETITNTTNGELLITVSIHGTAPGSIYFDNAFWGPATTAMSANQTIFRDELIKAYTDYKPGTLRNWYGGGQNGETVGNYILPMMVQNTALTGTAYSNVGTAQYSLGEFFALCQQVGVKKPKIVLPGTSSLADAQNLVDYLYGSSGTTYGALRIATGGPSASDGWATVFDEIGISFGNEQWLGDNLGQGLGFRSGSTSLYQDMATRANQLFTVMRAVASWNSSNAKLIIGVQTAQSTTYTTAANAIAHPDGDEANGYTQYQMTSTATSPPSPISNYIPALTETWSNTHDPASASGFYQQMNTIQGAGLEDHIYEENLGTFINCSQACNDALVDTGVTATMTSDQILENIDAGINNQELFEITQYYYTAYKHLWGATIDLGGQAAHTNSALMGVSAAYMARPSFLGGQIANNCVIGPQLLDTLTNQVSYNLATTTNNVHAISNVPTIRAFSFQNGSSLCTAVENMSSTTALPVTFSGTNAPTGSVVINWIHIPALNALNEATANAATNNVVATIYPLSSTVGSFNPSTPFTLQPFTVYTFTSGGGGTPTLTPPGFNPVAGIYTGTQSISLVLPPGATGCYTTDGSNPAASTPGTCSAGTTYSGAISISINTTINALSTEIGFTNSTISSATYAIVHPPASTPTFTPPGGPYPTAQTVHITSATPSATIYYTTDGTVPTTLSTVYSGPFTISVATTIQAIAVASGFSQSAIGTVTYNINNTLQPPMFQPSGGQTFTGSVSVAISSLSSPITLFYTVDGVTTPTCTAGPNNFLYSSQVVLTITTTLQAIGCSSGFTPSTVTSGLFTINPSPHVIVLPGPTILQGPQIHQ